MEMVLSAAISAFAAIVVGLINSRVQHNQLMCELDKHSEMNRYRIEELEKKVDKHNNLVERTYHLEEETRVLGEKLKVANHRIDDLEGGEKDG